MRVRYYRGCYFGSGRTKCNVCRAELINCSIVWVKRVLSIICIQTINTQINIDCSGYSFYLFEQSIASLSHTLGAGWLHEQSQLEKEQDHYHRGEKNQCQ
jgi:hypothetical protein